MLCLWERRRLLVTKEKKSRQVAELSDRFSRSKAIVITDYKGLTVAEISELRNSLKTVGGEYKVVKNTLALRASKGTPAEKTQEFFIGTTAVAFGYDDSIGVAKKILEFADKNEKLKIKSAVFEGSLISHQDLKAISKLPPRNVLLSVLAGTMNAPVSKLAAAFSAPITKFMYLLEALKNKKEQ
ncbi:MAG: 50S ribosomal protein L10 [Thermodesulfovibrionales bacterium]|nr:50S ribosomal protein L10 [Thermodesulfovibrionales bacterium]